MAFIHLFPNEPTAFLVMGGTSGLGKFHAKRLKQIISNYKVVLQISLYVSLTEKAVHFSSCFIFRCQENNGMLGILIWHSTTRISMARALFSQLHSFLHYYFHFSFIFHCNNEKRQHILHICGLVSQLNSWYILWIIHWNSPRISYFYSKILMSLSRFSLRCFKK